MTRHDAVREGRPAPVVAASEERGPLWCIVLRGRIDADTVGPFRSAVQEALRSHPGPVAVDTAAVDFCDSQTLSLLLRLASERPLAIVAPSPHLARMIEITGTDEILPVFPTHEEARSHLAAAG